MKSRRSRRGRGTPAWLIVLIAGACVFGFFYVIQGVQLFFRTGGLGVQEATQRAVVGETATAVRATERSTSGFTPQPTFTPPPECVDFRVTTDSGMVRASPGFNGLPVTSIRLGEIVCVLDKTGEWYIIDSNTETRRRELAYMHESILEAVNPTETPSPTAPASATAAPSETPAVSPTVFRLSTVTPNLVQTLRAERTRRTPDPQDAPAGEPTLTPARARTLPATLPLLPTLTPSAPAPTPTLQPLQSA